MIFGIGTDIVHIPRMKKLLDKYGDKIAKRILNHIELVGFIHSSNPSAFLARRFAAKEAAAKALGTGFSNGLSLRYIAIINDKLGKPKLIFSQRGLILSRKLNIGRSLVSLSDERDYAIAFVTLMESK